MDEKNNEPSVQWFAFLSLALSVVPAIYKNSMEASHRSHYVHDRVNKDKKMYGVKICQNLIFNYT